jgi:MFS family permease
MATAFALGTYPLPWTIERVGRRGVLMWSAAILTVTLIIFVAMIGLDNKTNATQWTAVAMIIIYNLVFGYGWIGVPWLYGPEVSMPHQPLLLTSIDVSRSRPSSTAISAAPQGHSASGCSPSLPCSQAASRSRTWAGRSGSGCCSLAPWQCLSSTSCVLK